MKTIIIIALAFLSLVAVGLLMRQHAWYRIGRAKVTLDGSSLRKARVYKNPSGDMLVDTRSATDETTGNLYVVRGQTVGIPNTSSLAEFGPIAFTKETTIGIVDLRSAKIGVVDPKLLVNSQSLSFLVEDGKTVHVNWD